MTVFAVRIELSDTIIQELLWRALMPEASVRTPTLNAELERRFAQLGGPPEAAQLTGVSVTIDGARVEAELEYTEPDAHAVGEAHPA
ncbi:MAG: hypothetical protein HGA45_07565 [Chloroflexales bacterium]|nr:hypothetical protein [Chloroflexales bacterium]